MRARGASPHAVRNLVYRGVGAEGDRLALFSILRELHQEIGLAPPQAVHSQAPAELSLLGREKRRAYRQFLAGVRAGRAPRLIVTGRAGTGKTLLIEHLERELLRGDLVPGVTRLLLGDEAAPALIEHGAESLRGLHAGLPYSVQAELQAQGAREVCQKLQGVLLLRVVSGVLKGTPPRLPDGTQTTLPDWALRYLFQELPPGVAALLALQDADDLSGEHTAEVIVLKPPTTEESRRFLLSRAALAPQEADEVLRAAGRNLDRLALLAAVHGLKPLPGKRAATEDAARDQQLAQRILADPDVLDLIVALCASLPDGETSVRRDVLEAALGRPLTRLPPHARALLEEINAQEPRPVSRALVPAVRDRLDETALRAAHERAARAYGEAARHDAGARRVLEARRLWHLTEAGAWNDVVAMATGAGSRGDLIAGVWPRVRRQLRGDARLTLAQTTVRHYASLGRYDHPDARDALSVLLEAPDALVRAWARLKLAESAVDRGAFDAAGAQLDTSDVQDALSCGGSEAGASELRADAALVRAAIARWRGDVSGAAGACDEALAAAPAASLDRVRLWRGLIAKDRGDWNEALRDLSAVSQGEGSGHTSDPLLRARARYQEGDLRLRLGQPVTAEAALSQALAALTREGAPADERARVQARLGTALRRLGRVGEARAHLSEAAGLLPDLEPVVTARVLSEAVPVDLALNRPDAGLRGATAALAWLERPSERSAEAAYRARRARYRIALSYLTRGLGRPYLPPLPGARWDNADLQRARELLDNTLAVLGEGADRDWTLRFDAYLSRALAECDPGKAADDITRALELVDHPYAEAQVRAARAEVWLRAGNAERALGEVNRAHTLLRRVALGTEPDPGLWAALLALETRASLLDGAPAGPTLRWLREALREPLLTPFREGVLREAGEALEGLGLAASRELLREVGLPRYLDDLRPADALRQLSFGS